MGYPGGLLEPDEDVLLDLRPHLRRLVAPLLGLLTVVAGTGFGLALVDTGRSRVAVAAVGVALLAAAVLPPYLVWWSTRLTVTDRRVMLRTGVVVHRRRDLPLSRVRGVRLVRGPLERLLGSGTLVLEAVPPAAAVTVVDVPQVEAVHRTICRLLPG